MSSDTVVVRREPVAFPSYEPLPPDKNPMFLERRVYQGSSGRVYPLPCYTRIAEQKRERLWDSVQIENKYIRVMVLPEIGGRIHAGEDKTSGYPFFYRQSVIKPALVGLAGPWISGGVEFNWPQHHRPATFMPVDVEIEEHADGSKTIWLGDHDPMERMKGMHGVCLHPDRALIELKVRAYNRTPFVQSFLWWANVATHVHEGYQSFFPPDVVSVADHAKRAMSRFPLCEDRYYGINYGARGREGVPAREMPARFVPPHGTAGGSRDGIPDYAPNDLSWYANIPVPTSYMCLGSAQDFSGGYDFKRRAGLVQVANHHIAPGKKQWTWGNHEFGYAWDRNLTDADGPYIELMLGVYTDNQPDFSFLQPGETKTWSVYWYPIQSIGPAQAAGRDAAVSFRARGRSVAVGVAVTRPMSGLRVEVRRGPRVVHRWTADVAPDRPFTADLKLRGGWKAGDLGLAVVESDGREIIVYTPPRRTKAELPAPATEPPPPGEVASADELYVIGQHLWQYRHATRSPVAYWTEALRRDPGDARCNTALGAWHLRRGEFATAEKFLRTAIARLTSRNPNPADGGAHYHLGLALAYQDRHDEAYAIFYKATWNQAWQSAGYHAIAEIDACRGDWHTALEHLDRSLRADTDNLRARNLRVIALRKLGRAAEADAALADGLALDPLDWWARHLRDGKVACDSQTRIDLAIDYARAGLFGEAIGLLEDAVPETFSGTAPLIGYHLAYLHSQAGAAAKARTVLRRARAASPDYCFPARLEDMRVLQFALEQDKSDARAACYLGNLYYDRRRYAEAIALWERSAKLEPRYSVVWRNLGIATFNVRGSARKAEAAYARAIAADPTDARLLYERDQLWKRLGRPTRRRLAAFEKHPELVEQRDDATVELLALLNQAGRVDDALRILGQRKFQPWEGGEGQVLGQYVRTHLLRGRSALGRGRPADAIQAFEAALHPTSNLGEARHLLANASDIYYWLGVAHAAAGDPAAGRSWWRRAADSRGDFQDMSVRSYSEMTYFAARSLEKLGRRTAARSLFREVLAHARRLRASRAKIDYFATSLPTMLLFHDDIQMRQDTAALFMQAQSEFGLGRPAAAKTHVQEVLRRDPSHAAAADLLVEIDSAG